MDRMDLDVEEEDIMNGDYYHQEISFHIFVLLLMELVYTLIHVIASFWLTDFYLVNPISLLLSMDGALLFAKKYFPSYLR